MVGTLGDTADGAAGARLVQVVVLAVLCLGLAAAVADRLADREIVGVAFILGMNLGHIAMLVALVRSADVGGPLVAFWRPRDSPLVVRAVIRVPTVNGGSR